jgi:hypothetical protein
MTRKEIEAFLNAQGIEVLGWGKTKIALTGGMIISRKRLNDLIEKKRQGLTDEGLGLR